MNKHAAGQESQKLRCELKLKVEANPLKCTKYHSKNKKERRIIVKKT